MQLGSHGGAVQLYRFLGLPRSAAICLFSSPCTTCLKYLVFARCKRGKELLQLQCRKRCARCNASCVIARSTASSRSPFRPSFVRKSSAPRRIARTQVGISPDALIKLTGQARAFADNARSRSIPLTTCMRKPTITQPGASVISGEILLGRRKCLRAVPRPSQQPRNGRETMIHRHRLSM